MAHFDVMPCLGRCSSADEADVQQDAHADCDTAAVGIKYVRNGKVGFSPDFSFRYYNTLVNINCINALPSLSHGVMLHSRCIGVFGF